MPGSPQKTLLGSSRKSHDNFGATFTGSEEDSQWKRAGFRTKKKASEESHWAEIRGVNQNMVSAVGALDLITPHARNRGPQGDRDVQNVVDELPRLGLKVG